MGRLARGVAGLACSDGSMVSKPCANGNASRRFHGCNAILRGRLERTARANTPSRCVQCKSNLHGHPVWRARPRRKFLRLAAGAAVLPVFSRGAGAVDYPVRPVRIVVGFPAGGATDVIARLMGQWLSERLGQQFLIENRPGAGGNIAAEAVVKATPDGYTLLQVGTPNAINAALYSNLSFNFIRDIAPVGSIMRVSYVIVVHPSVPATTVPEFIAYAKAN